MGAVQKVRDDTRKYKSRDDQEALDAFKQALCKHFTCDRGEPDLAPVRAVYRMVDKWLEQGKLPRLASDKDAACSEFRMWSPSPEEMKQWLMAGGVLTEEEASHTAAAMLSSSPLPAGIVEKLAKLPRVANGPFRSEQEMWYYIYNLGGGGSRQHNRAFAAWRIGEEPSQSDVQRIIKGIENYKKLPEGMQLPGPLGAKIEHAKLDAALQYLQKGRFANAAEKDAAAVTAATNLYALVYGDGSLYGATDNRQGSGSRYWGIGLGAAPDYDDEWAIYELRGVPDDLAQNLMAQGSREQVFGDGYEAWDAASRYVKDIVDWNDEKVDDASDIGRLHGVRVAKGIGIDALDSLVVAEAINLGLTAPQKAHATPEVIRASDKLRRGMGRALAAWEQHHPLHGGVGALTKSGGMDFALEALVGPGEAKASLAAWKKFTSRPEKLVNFLRSALERERRSFDSALAQAAVETAE